MAYLPAGGSSLDQRVVAVRDSLGAPDGSGVFRIYEFESWRPSQPVLA